MKLYKLIFNIYTKFFLLFIFCVLLFTYFQLSENFPDPDAFYHLKIGHLIWQNGVVVDFPWAQYTVLKDYYIDHHLLYHFVLSPFVNLLHPLVGVKVATILLASSFIFLFALIARALKLKAGILLGVIMAVTIPLTFRLNLVKANSLSLIILFLGIYLVVKKKYIWLFLLSFLYVWAYGGFAVLLLVAIIFCMARFAETKHASSLLPIPIVLGGFIAGIIINPYFPKNLWFYWQQVVQIGLVNYQDKIGVGGEWYPYGFVELITGCSLLTVLMVTALLIFFIFIKKQSALSWASFILYALGLFLVLKSRRYIEYYVPFTAFFIVNVFSIFSAKQIIIWLIKFWHYHFINKVFCFIAVIYILLVVPAIAYKDFKINLRDLRGGISYNKFAPAMEWLQKNGEKNTIVLHSDWDEFPMLLFHNSDNYYIVGLDPTFMYKYDEKKYWQWVDITTGKQKESLPKIIKNDFQAKYVFLEKDHTAMDDNMQNFSQFTLIYEDDEAKIYKLEM
ncbi:MAG: hypothetical protein WC752_00545 [Patescibacteria group bacterium]|jgi:hypothetical protein